MSFIDPHELAKYYALQPSVFSDMYDIAKGLGAIDTSLSPSFWNVIYGPLVWNYLNLEANVWNALPKTTWPRTGWRAIVGRMFNNPTDIVHDANTLPSFYRPDFKEFKLQPKYFSAPIEIEMALTTLAEAGIDDIAMRIQNLVEYMAKDYAKAINQLLIRRVIGKSGTTSVADDGVSILSLDRAVSSYEESQLGSTLATPDPVGAHVNVYGIDRTAGPSLFDAVVDATTDAGLANRPFTIDIVLSTLAKLQYNAANPTVMITGPDTVVKIWGLFSQQAIAMLPNIFAEGYQNRRVGDADTGIGAQAGVRYNMLYNIPIVTAVDTPREPKSPTDPTDDPLSLPRIYILDTSDVEGFGFPRTGFSILKPTTLYSLNNPLIAGKPAYRHLLMTIGETAVRRLNSNAKIRDLAA